MSDRREDKEDNPNEGWNPGGGLPMATVAVAAAAAAAAGWGRSGARGEDEAWRRRMIYIGEGGSVWWRQNPRLDSVG